MVNPGGGWPFGGSWGSVGTGEEGTKYQCLGSLAVSAWPESTDVFY